MDAAEHAFRLNRFFSWFRFRLANLTTLTKLAPSTGDDGRSGFEAERHVLLATGLDALANYWARGYAPRRHTHRWRMGEFLRLHGGPCWKLVAGPELRRRSATEHQDWLPGIAAIVGSQEASCRIRSASDDPTLEAFLAAAVVRGLPITEEWARRSLYREILYEYHRCGWVHELERSTKLGSEWFCELCEPHYENELVLDAAGEPAGRRHKPVFPFGFLLDAYQTALESFELKCRTDGMDPCTGETFQIDAREGS